MTLGIPGRPAPGPVVSDATGPVARISRTALAVNLRAVLASTRGGVIDGRADAWGHGLSVVAPLALQAGASAVLVDDAGARLLEGVVDAARLVHAARSAASDAVYGLSPGFTPVMSLRGRVLSLKRLEAGEGVSYGYTHRAAAPTMVALVTGGYAQGIVRSLGNAASVLVEGERHPIVGRVAMDVSVVDIGQAEVQRGDDIGFFGNPAERMPALSEWTAATGLTAAELVTAVGLQCAREYVP